MKKQRVSRSNENYKFNVEMKRGVETKKRDPTLSSC